jgi:hypothetical protein
LVALVAAYATALQVLFSAFSVAAPAGIAIAFHSAVCAAKDGRSLPIPSHDAACSLLCAMAAGGHPQGDPGRPAAVLAWLARNGGDISDFAVRSDLPEAPAGSPHRSRAPPSA